MEAVPSSTFIEKYLKIGISENLEKIFSGVKIESIKPPVKFAKAETKSTKKTNDSFSKIVNEIITYQALYKQKLNNPEKVKEHLFKYINACIENYHTKINVNSADINYYLKGVCDSYNEKFALVVQKMDINHIIKMLDYTNDKNEDGTFKILMNMYFKLFGESILCGKFGKSNTMLSEQINENWSSVNFENLLNFSDVLSKLKYYKTDTSSYDAVFQSKFDDVANIQKLLEFINKNYLSAKDNSPTVTDINNEEKGESKRRELKYNLRFIIENLKSNGFLLFEEYYKNLQSRYDQIEIETVYRDLKLIKHFMFIVSQNEKTNVNRYVNDMLIRTRNYLFDLQESYYNNQIYKKITIRAESDKYKGVDMTKYNRELTNFKILKYNYCTNSENILARSHKFETEHVEGGEKQNFVIDYKTVNEKLAGYFDIYRSYYKTRYPDREIEYDLIDSTIIVKMKFDEKPYYIHMALIQYIVLDKIMEKEDGINVLKLSESLGIPLSKLNDTLNSLLKIRITKRTANPEDVSNIKFVLNKDFTFEKNKLSISGLVKKEPSDSKPSQREFMHDREMIVLCNLVHYVKKNTYFTRDAIMEELSYKIPFKLTDEFIDKAIEKALREEYIKIQEVPNGNGTNDILYQYSNE
jgi:hypothetical protein